MLNEKEMEMEKREQIKSNPVYKQVIKEACGGVMYNIANRGKYNDKEIIAIWESMTQSEKDGSDGNLKGAMSFLLGK